MFGGKLLLSTQSSLLIRLRTPEDSEAWSRFVRIYTPLIHHWVKQLGVEANKTDDLIQDIFVALLGQVSMLAKRPPNSFRAWLRTITLNKCRDWFRQQNRKSNPRLLENIETAVEDPQSLLLEREYQTFVAQSALQLMRNAFSETTWRACWEHVALGKSAKKVSTELGITENAVYLARGRVLKRLRNELDGLWE